MSKQTKIQKKAMAAVTHTNNILPASYTKETACNLLGTYGLTFRHKDITQELFSKDSIYKQLLKVPAIAMHNQSLLMRIMETQNYVKERLTNIIFAVTAVKAHDPELKKPLSQKRQETYGQIQQMQNAQEAIADELAGRHDASRNEVYSKLYDQILDWHNLCYNTSRIITDKLIESGMSLPVDFADILLKHLERPGANRLSVEEKNALGVSQDLSSAELALACALKEVSEND